MFNTKILIKKMWIINPKNIFNLIFISLKKNQFLISEKPIFPRKVLKNKKVNKMIPFHFVTNWISLKQ